jgi:hypothetical protein
MKMPAYFRPSGSDKPFQQPVILIPSGVTQEASEANGRRHTPNFPLRKAIERFQRCDKEDADIASICEDEVVDMITRDVPSVPVQIVSPVLAKGGQRVLEHEVHNLPTLAHYMVSSDFSSTTGMGKYEQPFEIVANVGIFQLCRDILGRPPASQAEVDAYVSRCQSASRKLSDYQRGSSPRDLKVQFLKLTLPWLPVIGVLASVPTLYAIFGNPTASNAACPAYIVSFSPHATCVSDEAIRDFKKSVHQVGAAASATVSAILIGLVIAFERAYDQASVRLLQDEEFRDDTMSHDDQPES